MEWLSAGIADTARSRIGRKRRLAAVATCASSAFLLLTSLVQNLEAADKWRASKATSEWTSSQSSRPAASAPIPIPLERPRITPASQAMEPARYEEATIEVIPGKSSNRLRSAGVPIELEQAAEVRTEGDSDSLRAIQPVADWKKSSASRRNPVTSAEYQPEPQQPHSAQRDRVRPVSGNRPQQPPALDLTEARENKSLPGFLRGAPTSEQQIDGSDEPLTLARPEVEGGEVPNFTEEKSAIPTPREPSRPLDADTLEQVPPEPEASPPLELFDSTVRDQKAFGQQPLSMVPEFASRVGPDGVVNIPFGNADTIVTRRDFELRMNDGLITLIANDANLTDILAILAQDHGLNIVSSGAITSKVTVTLRDVPLADALNAILSIQGMSWSRRNNIISISKISADQIAGGAIVQGRVVRVYPLSYVMATDIEPVVKSLLSPVGQAKTMQSLATDSRKTSDRLIVEDLPDYLDRVDSCIKQLDRAPRQVQIEAHILEVDLSTDNRHGVNLEALSDIAGTEVSLKSPGFAKATSNPATLFSVDGSKVDSLLDVLKNTVDARTLASPQVLVTHGQLAKIQIGGKIGYRQSTTTETSTVQGVEFLDVGVVLTVTPYIGEDGQVLMKVVPEVSDGAINLDTELPDETITTVDSTVLLNDGQGMIIGGLIREDDEDQRNKTPFLGEIWMVGRLFQKIQQERARKEVIVVLVPRIVDCPVPLDDVQATQLQRAETPLFHGALERNYRPWEPELPEVQYRPGAFRDNWREFRRSEGTRWLAEPPRSGEYYLEDPSTSVPVTIETSPVDPSSVPMSQSNSPATGAVRHASSSGRPPVRSASSGQSVRRTNGPTSQVPSTPGSAERRRTVPNGAR